MELADNRGLGIAALGAPKEPPRIVRFCKLLRRHLSVQGDNLGNLLQYMKREYNDQFESIIQRVTGKIPGIDKSELLEIPEPSSFILIENPEKYEHEHAF